MKALITKILACLLFVCILVPVLSYCDNGDSKQNEITQKTEDTTDTTQDNNISNSNGSGVISNPNNGDKKDEWWTNMPATPYSSFKFSKCDGGYAVDKFIGEETKVIIPKIYNGEPVKLINYLAFYDCQKLTSVIIPNSVTSIGAEAFRSCGELTSIEIPDSVLNISIGAFRRCSKLKNIEIPDSVISIGGSAFQSCTGLISIEIPNSVINIDGYAFSNCTGLTSVTIPKSVKEIKFNAFLGCTGLKSIVFNGTFDEWNAINFDDRWNEDTGEYIIICTDITNDKYLSLSNCTFVECDGGYSLSAYNGKALTFIVPSKYNGKPVVMIGNRVIGNGIMAGEVYVENVIISDSILNIQPYAFEYGFTIKSITISSSVTKIGFGAFLHCENLTSINFDGTIAEWKAIMFGDGWDEYTGEYTVYCTDGTIAKNGTVTYN